MKVPFPRRRARNHRWLSVLGPPLAWLGLALGYAAFRPDLFPLLVLVGVLWGLAYGLWLWGHRRFRVPAYGVAPASLLTGIGLLALVPLMPGLALRQALWLLLVAVAAPGVLRLLERFPEARAALPFPVTLGLLGLTLVVGRHPAGQGPRLWLGCCGFFLQPAAWHKAALALWLAWVWGRRGSRGWWLPLVSLAILALQGDLGNLLLFYVLLWAAVLAQSPVAPLWKPLAGASALAVVALGAYWPRLYRRWLAWWFPFQDPWDAGYQILQALRALRAGAWWGRGPVERPLALQVPLVHTDLIYVLWAETWGWAGSVLLLLVLGWLMRDVLGVARRHGNTLAGRFALFLGGWWVLQIGLVLGGTLRLTPLTGMPLPFMAYGGSELTAAGLSLVWLNALARRSPPDPDPAPWRWPWPRVVEGLWRFGWGLLVVVALAHAAWLLR